MFWVAFDDPLKPRDIDVGKDPLEHTQIFL
jgi:hypothetical protein